jgi:hypothetical protein
MLYESIIFILIHVIIIVLTEFLIFILYLIPKLTGSIYSELYTIINNELSYELRSIIFYIFNLYNNRTLYEKAIIEKNQVTDNNNTTIYIFVGIILTIFVILSTILIVLYNYNISLNWKFILIIILISLILILIFNAGMSLIFIFFYKINDKEIQYKLMKKLFDEYVSND